MTQQFGKRIEAVVGPRRFTGHEIAFSAALSLSSDPDTCEIRVFNLSDSDRAAVETSPRNSRVTIHAGYGTDSAAPIPAIFQGRLRRCTTYREGPDLITLVEAPSAIRAREYGRQLNRTYRAGTTVSTVVRDLLSTLEVGEGTLSRQIASLQLDGAGQRFRAPFALQGPAWDSLVELLEASGYTVTTQGDDLAAIGISDVLGRTAIVLSEDTGLRGVPSVDARGVLTAECAMIPDLIPGRRVTIRSETIRGDFKILKAAYVGSLFGSDFGCQIEGRSLTASRR
jgi:hypothetical protein